MLIHSLTFSLIYSFDTYLQGGLQCAQTSLGSGPCPGGKTDEGVFGKAEEAPISACGTKEGSLEEMILWWTMDKEREGVPHRETCWRYEGTGIYMCLCLQEVRLRGHQSQVPTGLTQMPGYKFSLCIVDTSQGALDGL